MKFRDAIISISTATVYEEQMRARRRNINIVSMLLLFYKSVALERHRRDCSILTHRSSSAPPRLSQLSRIPLGKTPEGVTQRYISWQIESHPHAEYLIYQVRMVRTSRVVRTSRGTSTKTAMLDLDRHRSARSAPFGSRPHDLPIPARACRSNNRNTGTKPPSSRRPKKN